MGDGVEFKPNIGKLKEKNLKDDKVIDKGNERFPKSFPFIIYSGSFLGILCISCMQCLLVN